MATSSTVMVLFCIILCAVALEQPPPHARRSKRDTMVSSMLSFFSNVDKRLASMEANWKNSTENQLAQLEAKMEEEMQEKQQHMEERMQSVHDGMQRLESMVMELLSSRLEAMEQKVAELVEAKTNATEERLVSLEASNTEAQASPAACKYQFLYQYEKEAPRSAADLQRMTKLETELTRLQEKVSALDKRQQDNDMSLGSLHNASVLAMEEMVQSVTELVAASDQNLQSILQNATEILASTMKSSEAHMEEKFHSVREQMAASDQNSTENLELIMNATKTLLLAKAESNAAVFNASMARLGQTTKDLEARLSAVEEKMDNATSLQAGEMEKTRAMLEDVRNTTKGRCGTLHYKRTCQEYYDDGQTKSGVYTLELEDGRRPLEVYCDMRNGTGWVVFQRREDGSVNFYRDWTSYSDGFGDVYDEFWLGNKKIHRLTSSGLTQLRVDLQAWDGSTAFAVYTNFSVGDASSSYTLSVSGYSGTAGDSLKYNNGQKFSTFDQDHDTSSGNCAQDRKGAWWYGSCTHANLNAEYGSRDSSGYQYVHWYHWLYYQSLQRTELKLK